MMQVWLSAAGLCGATVLGSLLGFFIKELPHKWNDSVLGYCAGIMLAAATVGLIVPAFDMVQGTAVWLPALGVLLGAWLLNVLDLVTPHMHTITGLDAEEHKHNEHLNRIMLFVLAIAIHKLPEGMVVIAPLLVAGLSRLRTFMLSLAIGLLEIVGVWLGFTLGSVSQAMLPFMLALAGGAMLYVTSDEMIPETHAHGYQKQATYALLLGFMSILLMEHVLGG